MMMMIIIMRTLPRAEGAWIDLLASLLDSCTRARRHSILTSPALFFANFLVCLSFYYYYS